MISNIPTSFRSISEQFLSGLSVKKIDFKDVINDLADPLSGEAHQDMLLSLTVDHPLVTQYPLKIEYQQSFIRKLVQELEDRLNQGAEIGSNLYMCYVKILESKNGKNGNDTFRHYPLANGSIISLKESASIISNGTTGLCVWQAAHVLVNWCSAHREFLKGSTILELGSGVGLCGIAVSFLCHPQQYIFSDCHPAVMNILVENVKINKGVEKPSNEPELLLSSIDDRIMWSGKLRESTIAVAHLPWEDIVAENLAPKISPSYVIASDVVYDPSIFDALANTLQKFVNLGSQVILTCTDRNSDTLLQFLKTIGSLGLEAHEEAAPQQQIIPLHDDSTVKIYRIGRA